MGEALATPLSKCTLALQWWIKAMFVFFHSHTYKTNSWFVAFLVVVFQILIASIGCNPEMGVWPYVDCNRSACRLKEISTGIGKAYFKEGAEHLASSEAD